MAADAAASVWIIDLPADERDILSARAEIVGDSPALAAPAWGVFEGPLMEDFRCRSGCTAAAIGYLDRDLLARAIGV